MYAFVNHDYGDPGNYVRVHGPAEAIKINTLPPPMRARVAGLRLPLRFADHPRLHLADWLADEECHTYGDTTLRGEPYAPAPSRGGTHNGDGGVVLLGLLLLGLLALGWVLL